MGKRGPAPLPATVHASRGTHRRDRHGDPGSPFTLAGPLLEAPAPPQHLAEAEAAIWLELVPIFHGAGILDGGDLPALEAMIVAVARARRADRELRVLDREGKTFGGLVSVGDRGLVTHPLVKISRDAWAEARSWFAKFGATPSDRVGLAVGGLQGLTLAEALERALNGEPTKPAPLQLELAAELGECGNERRGDRAPCLKEAGHGGKHRYQ